MGGMLPRNHTKRTISALILLVVLPSLMLAGCSRNRAAARGGAAAATTSSLEEIADSSTTTTVGAGSTITGNSGVNGAPPSTGPEASSTTRRSSSTVTSATTRRTTTTTRSTTTTTRPKPKLVKLTVNANRPDGSGSYATSAPGAISCPGGACSDSFAKGTSITLTAHPQESGPTWVFSDGKSPCEATSPTCTFDLTAALTVTINFAE
jgi:hypothetical protein